MTDLAHGADDIGGRFGRLGLRVLLIMILASPVAVGFLLAPKADDGLPPLPGADEPADRSQSAEAGLGQSSAEHAFGSEQPPQEGGRRQRRQRAPETAEAEEAVA